MSSLWTPGGEHPVEPSSSPQDPPVDPSLEELSPEDREKVEAMAREMAAVQEQLASTPAAVVVANHLMGFYELAAIHLSQQPPDLSEASVAIDALAGADVVVIAPSNPIVSIGPLLAVPGIADALRTRRADTVAVSPIVAGAALKGPADRLMRELGHEASVVGVARLYRDLAATLVVDTADAGLADAVEAEGMACVVTDTIMSSPDVAAGLARRILGMPAEDLTPDAGVTPAAGASRNAEARR